MARSRMHRWLGLASGALLGTLPVVVNAAQAPSYLAAIPELDVAPGIVPIRAARDLAWHEVPRHAAPAWSRLVTEMGSGTQAVWDRATGVPSRIWGAGIPVPGSVASSAAAESFAKAFLARHIELLAPGAAPSDFDLVSTDLDAGMRTLGFGQTVNGVPVLGGQVSFRFKADRLFMIGSEALPHVVVDSARITDASARAAARRWLLSDVASSVTETGFGGPFVLPLIGEVDVRYATVFRVKIDAEPLSRWDVYVDAASGAPVARQQTIRFASATVQFSAPERYPALGRQDYPASFAELSIAGLPVTTDLQGLATWSGTAPVSAVASATGTYAHVDNAAGGNASMALSLSAGGTALWNPESSEFVDSQVSVFVHTNRIVDFARGFAGDLPYLDTQVQGRVNIDNSCNAFYDGNGINFYREAGGCNNTGRLADVIYHEYGHSLHDHSIIVGVGAFEGAASEGLSDFLAATYTGDPAMGRGFFNSDAPLRHIDPSGTEQVWPQDIGEAHYTGLIIAGALWDMRTALVEELGDAEGVAVTNQIFYQAMRRAVDIPTMYFEALAADDDDGDLTNGTPHICGINAGFTPHGLRKIIAQGSKVAVVPPHQESYTLSLALIGLYHACPSDQTNSAEVTWRLRDQPEVGGTLPMALGETGFEAVIPTQPDGSVVQYQVNVHFEDGTDVLYPDNPADPYYEMFIGHLVPLYCTDFEADPAAEGWTHGLTAGTAGEGADDWTWDVPQAPSDSGDPHRAYSGDRVFGNDLGGGNYNGQYQPDKTNFALSPAVDTTGYDVVRLQYRRWLTVEDGQFDQATIYADDVPLWSNLAAGAEMHHVDREWRFSDVDLSAQAADGSVVVRYELSSDSGLTMGGWTIDDFCVLGYIPTVCGDGLVTGLEACDDGALNSDVDADACRADCMPATCGDGVADTGEGCDDGNDIAEDGCEVDCTLSDDGATPGAAEPPFGLEDDGCGCRTVGSNSAGDWRIVLLGVALTALRRRRAR